jgi:hypothetical protein
MASARAVFSIEEISASVLSVSDVLKEMKLRKWKRIIKEFVGRTM